MSRANFSYKIKKFNNINFIVIVDLDRGECSVTNDIRAVIESIASIEDIVLSDYHVVYRDSQGIWDGYNTDDNTFIAIQMWDEKRALEIYCQKLLKGA